MLKRLLLSTALITASVLSASALELECGAPRTLVGEDTNDTNPVARIAVGYSYDDHAWRVFHQLRNGAVVSRQTQYGIADASNSIKTQWQGRLLRQPWLFMIGEVRKSDNSEFLYHEWMYDSKQANRLVMQSIARCTARTPSPQLPTPTSQAPTQPFAQTTAQAQPGWNGAASPVVPLPPQRPSASTNPTGKDSVPIIVDKVRNAVHVDVLLGGMPLRMLVDTGANSSQIPQSFASMLIRNGSAAVVGDAPITYANGSKSIEQVLRVRELRIGSHVIRDILVTVSDGTPLIGFPVINGIAPFTIDTRNGELIWHTTKG